MDDYVAIHDTLHRYCHGIDRLDLETLKSAYWEDGTHDIGMGPLSAHAFCESTIGVLKGMQSTQHTLSNIMIQFRDGENAAAQSYVIAYHQMEGDTGPREMVVGGRYLDRLVKRGDAWKIHERTYVMDWNRNSPSTMKHKGGLYDALGTRGARFPDDPSIDFV